MMDQGISALIDRARTASRDVETRRQEMLQAAFRRQESILSLKAAGMSVRTIAGLLGVSAGVVQAQITTATGRRPKTTRREERVPYELHVSVLMKLETDPDEVRDIGLKNLTKMESTPRASIAKTWIKEWKRLLNGPLDQLRDVMLGDTELARELRQFSPFAGAISQEERMDAIRKAAA